MIRRAKKREAKHLSEISLSSKGYWNYPSEYFRIWRDELIITPKYIDENSVFVYEDAGHIVAYYSIVHLINELEVSGINLVAGHWLEHLFVVPEYIGKGIGSWLFKHLLEYCDREDIVEIRILADPHSRGFYEKMGCIYQREFPSSIAGRTTPLLSLKIKNL